MWPAQYPTPQAECKAQRLKVQSQQGKGSWLAQSVEHGTLDLGLWVRAPDWV